MGQTEVGETWNWVFPHIFVGIPTVVPGFFTSVYEMKRDTDRKFLSISGLTDDKSLYHCKCTNQSNITYLIATICYYFVSVPLPIPIYASQTNWFLNLFLNYWLLKLLQNVLFHIPNIIST